MVEPPERGRPASSPYLSHAVAGALREVTERRLLEKIKEAPVPRHLGIITDGNRRFAAEHGLLVADGHEKGKDKIEEVLDWCLETGIRILTIYALSTENLDRPADEVSALMDLFERAFNNVATDERVHRHHIRVRAFGNLALLPPASAPRSIARRRRQPPTTRTSTTSPSPTAVAMRSFGRSAIWRARSRPGGSLPKRSTPG